MDFGLKSGVGEDWFSVRGTEKEGLSLDSGSGMGRWIDASGLMSKGIKTRIGDSLLNKSISWDIGGSLIEM